MNTSTSKLLKVEHTFNRFRQKTTTIHIETTLQDGTSREEEVQIRPGFFHYGGIVDAIITHHYPADKMSAVQNNFLGAPDDPEAIQEFNDMQSWRSAAKAIAKAALEAE